MQFEEWKPAGGAALCAMGTFESPVAEHLPNESNVRLVNFQIVVPHDGGLDTAIQKNMPFVIHLPATGDEGFGRRRELFAKPLLKRGIASIIIQIPFYGKRRMPGQKSAGLLTLEHSALQSLGTVMEAQAIAQWLRDEKMHKGHVCFTGVSYGGSMAALTSLVSPTHNAVVSMIPSHSPAPPFVDGSLARTINFDIFPGGKKEVEAILSLMDIASIGLDKVVDSIHREYIQLTAKHDKYIPAYSAKALFEGMSKLRNVSTELRHLDGGHVAAFLFGAKPYVEAIDEAILRLSKRLDD